MRRAWLVVGVAVLFFNARGAAAACLTPQWTQQSISAGGSLRAGDTAVGDFDGDGFPDVAALAQTAIGQPWTRVIVSHAGGAAATVYTGTNLVGRIFATDVNGDGRADIVVAEMTAKSIVVLTGRSNGTFNAPITTALTKTPVALLVADLTGDKKPDVVLYESTSQGVLVLKGDGAGHFTQSEDLPLSPQAYCMAAGDFNGDGALDVAIGHFQFNELTVLYGHGDGTFQGALAVPSGNWPAGIAAGDLDGDGRADLVTADYADGKVTVLLNDQFHGFKAPARYNAATNPSGVALADVNGDKKLDIAVATLNGDKAQSFTNKGDGTFRAAVNAACSNCNLVGIAAADFNGDKRLDLVTGSSSLIVYTNNCGASRVTLTPRAATINALESATFDVTVSGVVDGAPTPTGTVTLMDGATALKTVPVGSAGIVVSGLAAGTHEVTANYSGDAEYDPNASPAAQQVVKALVTSLLLTHTPESSVSGQPVSLVAHAVSSGAQPSGGTTTISVDGVDVKTSNGSAAAHTITPPAGTITLTARYSGDATYAASTAGTIVHTVLKATPAIEATPLYPGGVAVTVVPPFAGTPTGNIYLVEGPALIASAVADAGGRARLDTSSLAEGTHQLRILYGGDAQFNATDSAPFSFTVSPYVPTQRRRAAHH